MIREVRVNQRDVSTLKESAIRLNEFSTKLSKGEDDIIEMSQILRKMIGNIEEHIDELGDAGAVLDRKIDQLRERLSNLQDRLEDAEYELSELEDHLNSIDAWITKIDEDGIAQEQPNPMYDLIEAKIEVKEAEIEALQNKIDVLRQKLQKAYAIKSKIEMHTDKLRTLAYSLNEKITCCQRQQGDLEDVRRQNNKTSTEAIEKLTSIERLIKEYRHVKMRYESMILKRPDAHTVHLPNININIQVNKKNAQSNGNDDKVINNDNLYHLTDEEIAKHRITFDNQGRITSYDGRTYGGKYNTYQFRRDNTCSENTPAGFYESGIRGEGKFIPYARTVEGIEIIKILKEYNLDGIVYRNAEPDFEVCAEAVVTIPYMTENRENYEDLNGNRISGNFAQASEALAVIWNQEYHDGRNDWNARAVDIYRREHKLTWHEKCDTKTMVLVRQEINAYFKHSGGVSECRKRDSIEVVFDE